MSHRHKVYQNSKNTCSLQGLNHLEIQSNCVYPEKKNRATQSSLTHIALERKPLGNTGF